MTTIIGRVSNPRGSSMRHSHNPLYSTGKSRGRKGHGKGKGKGRKRNPGMMHRLMNPGGIDIQKVLITTGIVAGASYASDLVTDMINENVFEANGMTGAPRALANIAMGALAIFGGMYADAKMKGPISYTCVGIAFAVAPQGPVQQQRHGQRGQQRQDRRGHAADADRDSELAQRLECEQFAGARPAALRGLVGGVAHAVACVFEPARVVLHRPARYSRTRRMSASSCAR